MVLPDSWGRLLNSEIILLSINAKIVASRILGDSETFPVHALVQICDRYFKRLAACSCLGPVRFVLCESVVGPSGILLAFFIIGLRSNLVASNATWGTQRSRSAGMGASRKRVGPKTNGKLPFVVCGMTGEKSGFTR